MSTKHDRTFARAETDFARVLWGVGNEPQETVGAVADVTALDLKKSGRRGTAFLSAVSALADAAARGAADADSEIGAVAEGFLLGAMFGSEEKDDRALAIIGHAAGTFLKHAYQEGFDAAAAAKGLAEGAAAWAGERGLDSGAAATAAGRGALAAAEDVDDKLGRKVRSALTDGLIAGVAVILNEPVPSASGSSPER